MGPVMVKPASVLLLSITGPISGTITGNPVFSGNPSFTGGPVFSGPQPFTTNSPFSGEIDPSQLIRSNRTSATDSLIEGRATGDANARWFVKENGDTLWGPGSAIQDVTLRRVAAQGLQVDGTFIVSSPSMTGAASHFGVTTTAGAPSNSKILDLKSGGIPVLQVTNGGFANFTPSDTSVDGVHINLPNTSTGKALDMQNNSSSVATFDNTGMLSNYMSNTPITYTPTVGGGGSATFTTQFGSYFKIGKMVMLSVYIQVNVAGSGGTGVTVALPSVPFRAGAGANTTRQLIPLNCSSVSSPGTYSGIVTAGGTLAQIDPSLSGTNITPTPGHTPALS